MGRTLCYLGLAVLAGATWFLVAGEGGWIDPELSDRWFLPLAKIGGAVFVAGLFLGMIQPVLRHARRGRCVRCGAVTERNQSYCLDHLQATVYEAQDEMRRSQGLRKKPAR